MPNNQCIVIVGPTAVGKTALALGLAEQLRTAIISADSRQCYRELNIGVAKPTTDQLARVFHYFIDSHSIHDTVNAAVFEQYALEAVNTVFQSSASVVMVGGTGLYIKAFCEGLDKMPPIIPATRAEIRKNYEEQGLGWLQQTLSQQDPAFFTSTSEIDNPHRLMRALEVWQSTGRSITAWRQHQPVTREFVIQKIGLELPREELYTRINERVDDMISQGLVEEVQALLPVRRLPALQTVGYQEIFAYLDGDCSLEEAIEKLKQHSRQYAKRQLTWFKRDPAVIWYNAREMSQMLEDTNRLLSANYRST